MPDSAGSGCLTGVRRFDIMNILRATITISWMLFLLLCLLLGFSWHHRLLRMALFIPAGLILGFTRPRLPQPSPKARLLLWLAFVVSLFAVIVHGFLFPFSAGLYLLVKVLCPLLVVPALCCKAYADYATLTSSRSASA